MPFGQRNAGRHRLLTSGVVTLGLARYGWPAAIDIARLQSHQKVRTLKLTNPEKV